MVHVSGLTELGVDSFSSLNIWSFVKQIEINI